MILLHRQLLGLRAGDGLECDHINRDRLDNRRENLRAVTHAQNMQNRGPDRNARSPYRGVYFASHCGRWAAEVRLNRHKHWFGYHDTQEAAAAAAAAGRAILMPFSEEAAR